MKRLIYLSSNQTVTWVPDLKSSLFIFHKRSVSLVRLDVLASDFYLCCLVKPRPGFDYSVDNESLETLYWLKWGFVIEITGYVYSQKCKKNAKLNWVITFRILVTFFSKYKQKNASRVSRAQNVLIFSFWHFHYTFDDKYSQWS